MLPGVDERHPPERSPGVPDVVGYTICSHHGNHWVRDEVACRTGGMCPEAFAETHGQRSATLELVGRGMKIQIPVRKRRHKPKTKTPAQQARKRESERAKDAARKRLAAMFPDLYDMLVADERAARGLEPWPTERAIRGGDATVELGFAELLSELDDRGVDTT